MIYIYIESTSLLLAFKIEEGMHEEPKSHGSSCQLQLVWHRIIYYVMRIYLNYSPKSTCSVFHIIVFNFYSHFYKLLYLDIQTTTT